MRNTLEKVRRLEKYLSLNSSAVDNVLDTAIDKLLTYEISRLLELKARLTDQLEKFEDIYGMNSDNFYNRYEKGKMGDNMDFIEWASTVEMLNNAEKQLLLLKKESIQ